jgi:hypothetical protein
MLFSAGFYVLTAVLYLVGYFTDKLTKHEQMFLLNGAGLYVVFMVFFKALLLGGSKDVDYLSILTDDNNYYLGVFFILWYFCSTMTNNYLVPSANNYSGFLNKKDKWLSDQKKREI